MTNLILEQICQVFDIAYRKGWTTSCWDGNASVSFAGEDFFYISTSGIPKHSFRPEHFLRVKILDDHWQRLSTHPCTDALSPTGEIPVHWPMHRHSHSFQTDRVILHLHPTHVIAALHAGHDLNEISARFPNLKRKCRIAPDIENLPESADLMAEKTFQHLGLDSQGCIQHDIVAIGGHGVVSVASDPFTALSYVERVNHIAEVVLLSGK